MPELQSRRGDIFAVAVRKGLRAEGGLVVAPKTTLTLSSAIMQPPEVNSSIGKYSGYVYALMRIIVGLMLACHGLQLVFGMFGGMPGSGKLITQVGGWIQLVGGVLIAFGLLTRLCAFICSGMMAVAYFMFHVAPAATLLAKFVPIASAGPQFSNKGELAIVYCFAFLYMFFRGGGPWSLDSIIWRNERPLAADEVGGPMRTGNSL